MECVKFVCESEASVIRRHRLNRQSHGLAVFTILVLFCLAALQADIHPRQAARAGTDEVAVLGAAKDNTLYESATGAISNGAGEYFFAGTTLPGDIRRAVIAFDVAGNLPAGSTINSVTLTLNMSRTVSGSQTVALHRLLADWGEGSSNAPGAEGEGAPSALNDATWIHTFFNTLLWSDPGGSFTPTASASLAVGTVGSYTWGSTSQMVADVQAWLDSPAANFGWILVGNESANQTAKRFDSRQNPSTASHPVLSINYTPPVEPTPTDTPTVTPDPSATLRFYLPFAANP